MSAVPASAAAFARLDAGVGDRGPLAETQASISAATAQMGLEAALRAAVAPFPAAAGISLTVSGEILLPLLSRRGAT